MQSFVIEGGRPLSGTRARRRQQERRPADSRRNGSRLRAGAARRTSRASATSRRWSSCSSTSAPTPSGPGRTRCGSTPRTCTKSALDPELCREIRASFLLAGPLLARFGRAVVPPPGGDVIGRRRLDTHIHAFAELGVEVELNGAYDLRTAGLEGNADVPRRSVGDGRPRTRSWRPCSPRARPSSDMPPASRTSRISAASSSRSARGSRASARTSCASRVSTALGGGTYRIGPEHIEVASFVGAGRGHGRAS